MLEPLFLEGTDDTPQVHLDKEKGIFEISKKSLPEDAVNFFRPIFDWINSYIDNPNPSTEFVFFFEYFSTSTAKQLSKLMILLEKLGEFSKVKILWKFIEGDIDMETEGKRYKQLIDLDIEIQSVPDEFEN